MELGTFCALTSTAKANNKRIMPEPVNSQIEGNIKETGIEIIKNM